LKHGLFAIEVVIRTGDGKESVAEFKRLLQEFREKLQPVGILEETLVERIVVCIWRLKRVARCEAGEIRSKLDTVRSGEPGRRLGKLKWELQLFEVTKRADVFECSSFGVELLLEILDRVFAELEEGDELSEESEDRLEFFGTGDNSLADLYARFNPSAEPGTEEDGPRVSRCELMDAIAKKATYLGDRLEVLQKYDAMALEAKVLRLGLPDKATVDKLLRYETTVERQLYRAIAQLDSLQSRRRGKPVPPSVNVVVTGDK
jgi:hypothetical protein